MPERNWSTKTLARQLRIFLDTSDLGEDATLKDLLKTLKDSIVMEEVGLALDPWEAQPKTTKRPDPRDSGET
jgi:hypothetical protein